MQFLNEIRAHLDNYETEAKAEIHEFIDWLYSKYQPPSAPVVAPPETSYVEVAPTFTPATVASAVAPVEPAPAPVETQVEDAPVDPVPPAVEG
jgi:hypothetical protein